LPESLWGHLDLTEEEMERAMGIESTSVA